ncbi:MAG TPA: flavin reductase family protein [Xanthobacteraceae bacterium]|jgi:flavin reductase (DIM6/NTAB) family NADH-FMN oxidoreductase RutF|nr:flavin reductase family protein [Xanthobacteraceae bacterium]
MTNATKTERPSPNVIDAKTFWRTLGERAIGATIVTAQGADGPAGFLGLSATHVCADPPSMLVSIDRKTSALAAVLHGHHFAINYLGRDARTIADMFAGKTATKGAARFEPGRWGTLTTGAPVFNDAIGAVDCVLEKTIDHFATTVVIGRVVDVVARGSGDPLIYFRGGFLND